MDIEKHLFITGSSENSWKDAVTTAITEASKSIDYLSNVKILNQYAKISGNKISKYFVDLDISFIIDLERKDWLNYETYWNKTRIQWLCW